MEQTQNVRIDGGCTGNGILAVQHADLALDRLLQDLLQSWNLESNSDDSLRVQGALEVLVNLLINSWNTDE